MKSTAYEKMVREIKEYESDTFSASGRRVTWKQARMIADQLITWLIDDYKVYWDGVHLSSAYDYLEETLGEQFTRRRGKKTKETA